LIAVEESISESVRDSLASHGHKSHVVERLGNAHGLFIEYDAAGKPVKSSGGADPRGEGLARGY
jgi:gamma-glutamyltranspeptidase